MIYAVQLAREGRMKGLDGDIEDLFPGIDVRLAKDIHTAASQYVVVPNDGETQSEGAFIYTGDLVYGHDNLHGGNPDDPFYSASASQEAYTQEVGTTKITSESGRPSSRRICANVTGGQ